MNDVAVVGYGALYFAMGVMFGSGPRWWTSRFLPGVTVFFAALGDVLLFVGLGAHA